MSDRLDQLTKMHAADPGDPFCTYGIAMEHVKARCYDEAVQWLDKTLAIDPQYCYAYYQKAKALSQLGRGGEARRVLGTGLATAQQAGDEHAHREMTELLADLHTDSG